jgi:hypothetical protein
VSFGSVISFVSTAFPVPSFLPSFRSNYYIKNLN